VRNDLPRDAGADKWLLLAALQDVALGSALLALLMVVLALTA
jgi:hypothetical protein